jgi:hypothetical protein
MTTFLWFFSLSPEQLSFSGHFLRSLKSDDGARNAGHFMRSLRSDNSHFLRALRAYGSKDLQRILRSDPEMGSLKAEDSDEEFGRSVRNTADHFLRSLRSDTSQGN